MWAVKLTRNIVGLGCQSVLLLNILENWSTSILCFPGMCAAEMKELFLKNYNHISFFLLYFLDLISLLLLIYATTAELYDVVLACL